MSSMWEKGSGVIAGGDLDATGDFQGEVRNFELHMAPANDVFRTRGSSQMALGG